MCCRKRGRGRAQASARSRDFDRGLSRRSLDFPRSPALAPVETPCKVPALAPPSAQRSAPGVRGTGSGGVRRARCESHLAKKAALPPLAVRHAAGGPLPRLALGRVVPPASAGFWPSSACVGSASCAVPDPRHRRVTDVSSYANEASRAAHSTRAPGGIPGRPLAGRHPGRLSDLDGRSSATRALVPRPKPSPFGRLGAWAERMEIHPPPPSNRCDRRAGFRDAPMEDEN